MVRYKTKTLGKCSEQWVLFATWKRAELMFLIEFILTAIRGDFVLFIVSCLFVF